MTNRPLTGNHTKILWRKNYPGQVTRLPTGNILADADLTEDQAETIARRRARRRIRWGSWRRG